MPHNGRKLKVILTSYAWYLSYRSKQYTKSNNEATSRPCKRPEHRIVTNR